jgi:hypothetical protein
MMNRTLGGLALAAMLFATACGGSDSSATSPTTSPAYTQVTASVNPPLLSAGDSALASINGRTRQGRRSTFGPVPITHWTTSNPSVATVTAAGEVTAVGPGTAILTAMSSAGPYEATVTVFGATDISFLDVTCTSPVQVKEGTSCRVRAWTRLGPAPVPATWSSSTPEVASILAREVAASGVYLNTVSPGQTVITATYGTFTASATLEVR